MNKEPFTIEEASSTYQLATDNCGLQKGYKQTEVGVIPEDWEVYNLIEVCTKITDGTHDTPKPVKFGVPFLTAIHVKDDRIEYDDCQYLTKEDHDIIFKRCNPEIDDVLMVNIGAGVATTALVNVDYEFSLKNVALLKPISNRLLGSYLNYYLAHKKSRIVQALLSGGAQPFLSLSQIGQIKIPLPTPKEQFDIATALSDVDALLAKLDQLITKKRDLKQAAMQQLLTGQTRLPGFSGEWEIQTLRDECTLITKGTTPTSLGKNFTSSGINFIKIESLEENGKIIKDKIAFIDQDTNNLLKRSQLCENDILVSIAGALGRITVITSELLPANTNQALAIVRLKTAGGIDHGFLFYYLNSLSIKKYIEAINVQAAQANLSLENVGDFVISFPLLPEQIAIATVLSDMDAEITALEVRQDKTRDLKQGMMQELLTGRIRLI